MSEKKCYITVNCEDDTPKIGENGNWFIGDQDTGIKAQGPKEPKGDLTPEIVNLQLQINQLKKKLTNYYKLSGGTPIPPNADLFTDAYKKPGNYYCGNNFDAETLIHRPTKRAFTLKVALADGVAYPSLTLKEYFTGKIFYTHFNMILTNGWTGVNYI